MERPDDVPGPGEGHAWCFGFSEDEFEDDYFYADDLF